MKHYTFKELRELAIANYVDDNKVSIGIWAKINGFMKMRKKKDKQLHCYYVRPLEDALI